VDGRSREFFYCTAHAIAAARELQFAAVLRMLVIPHENRTRAI
jgi:hypothetical protein